LEIPGHLPLADPHFDTPGDIDLLIGADYFYEIMCVGQVRLGERGPYAQKTRFGWVISGVTNKPINSCHTLNCNLIKTNDVDVQLSRFWEIEEFPQAKLLSSEERACEKHFQETTWHDSDGRFVVTIPLAKSIDVLGDSYMTAEKRFYSLERKFRQNEDFKTQYVNFINEYQTLGHMVKVKANASLSKGYYMPHHGVINEGSLTTKLRVVFDASCPTSTGYSFNDLQMTGPTIQSDLLSILLRFRKHNYVIAADVEKMYRMCRINPEQSSLQRILWRSDPLQPLETYELVTVTYGTRSASYLAIRSLFQIGIDCEREFPEVSRIIKDDFYVDDMLTGAESIEKAIVLGNGVARELSKASFHLRKWNSNDTRVLAGLKTFEQAEFVEYNNI